MREAARRDKDALFTSLLHHVDVDRLRGAYKATSPKAAPGVDAVTWRAYGVQLEDNLWDLHDRVHSGAYRAKPSRRAYIPEADGRMRPLGIASLEDKVHHIADTRVLRLIQKWLNAGVIEDGEWSEEPEGSPQGGLCAAAHNRGSLERQEHLSR